MGIPRMVFDIETGPAAMSDVKSITRFDGDKPPKLPANWKEETKVAKLLEWEKNKGKREEDYYFQKRSSGTLNPLYGRIIAIGVGTKDQDGIIQFRILSGDENDILSSWWEAVSYTKGRGGEIFGYNIEKFDLPYITARTLIHGVKTPFPICNEYGKWDKSFTDLARKWMSYQYSRPGDVWSMPKYEELCAAFGIKAKTQGFRGDAFWKVWEKDRSLAEKYVMEEAETLYELSEKLAPTLSL